MPQLLLCLHYRDHLAVVLVFTRCDQGRYERLNTGCETRFLIKTGRITSGEKICFRKNMSFVSTVKRLVFVLEHYSGGKNSTRQVIYKKQLDSISIIIKLELKSLARFQEFMMALTKGLSISHLLYLLS